MLPPPCGEGRGGGFHVARVNVIAVWYKAGMARRLGVTRAALYNVIDQRSAVSAYMAVRFEAATGTSADLLVRMQAGHDLWRARQLDKASA